VGPLSPLYEAAFQACRDPLFVTGIDAIEAANEAGCRLLGVEPETVRGRRITELCAPGSDSATELHALVERCVTNGEAGRGIFSGLGAPDAPPYEARLSPLPGQGGGLCLLSLRDMGPWAEVRDHLRRQRDLNSKVLDTVRSLVIVLDASGRIVSFNRACEVTTGFQAEEMIGLRLWDHLIPEDDREDVERAFKQLAGTGLPSVHENHWLTKDGEQRLISWSNASLRGPDGTIEYIMGTGQDITESRKAEEHRERLTRNLGVVIETTRDLMGIADVDQLLRRAVALARDRLGAERCSVFIQREGQFQGTYGTDMEGRTTDERDVRFTADSWRERMREADGRGWWLEEAPHSYWRDGREYRSSTGWIAVTPIRSAGDPIGFLFNDAAITGAEVDEALQQSLALYASALGVLVERARATSELSRTRALLTTAIDASPAGILIAGAPDGRIWLANRAALRIRQADHASLTDIPIEKHSGAWDVHYPSGEPVPPEELPLSRAIQRGDVSEDEHFLIGSGPAVRRISANAAPVRDGSGEIVAGIVVFADITDREAMTEALREAEREKSVILDSMSDQVMYLSTDHRVRWANWAAAREVGSRPAEMVGAVCPFKAEGRCAACPVAHTLQTGRAEVEEFVAADGRVWHLRSYPVKGSDGSVHGAVEIARDVTEQRERETERQRLEGQVHRAQRLESLGVLAGGIAHDFNNILGAIMGYTELALSSLDSDDAARSSLSEVLVASERARDLVAQILAFSRRADMEQRPIMLGPIVTEALKFMRATLPSTISIQREVPADSPVVLADATQIHQVIMNLCTNAQHAMRESGGILTVRLDEVVLTSEDAARLRCRSAGPHVRLSVSDTGCGMPPEVIERIFDPFFSTKRSGEGTGLGLSTVHGIVGSHGGAVTARSSEGEGSAFEVYLPVADSHQHPRDLATPPVPHGGERVLFVDDEQALVAMNQDMLAGLGYQVTAVVDSREALELVRESPKRFDLLITDYTMPHLTGTELMRRLRELRPDLPAIMVSGHTQDLQPADLEALGIRRMLPKPYSLAGLAEAVRAVLDEAHSPRPHGDEGAE
jgi:PAS domain S-box-containing protein